MLNLFYLQPHSILILVTIAQFKYKMIFRLFGLESDEHLLIKLSDIELSLVHTTEVQLGLCWSMILQGVKALITFPGGLRSCVATLTKTS